MQVSISITKNNLEEEGVAFIDEKGKGLYFIPFRHLFRIDRNFEIFDGGEKIGNVLLQVIRVARYSWSTKDTLTELAQIIHKNKPDLDEDVLCDTFIAASKIKKINLLADEYEIQNPVGNYDGTKIPNRKEWKNNFLKYLKTKI